MRERETKLQLPPAGLEPRDIDDAVAAVAGVTVDRVDERTVVTHYYDTDDFRLARSGCTLRHRAAEGWTVKVPVDHATSVVTRDEIRVDSDRPGGGAQPPAAALRFVDGFTLGAKVRRVAELVTERRALALRRDGAPLAELTDDRVQVTVVADAAGTHTPTEFRELELELDQHVDDHAADAVLDALLALGCVPSTHPSKIRRALGPAAAKPPDLVVPDVPRHPSAGEVVRYALAASVEQLLRSLPIARAGEDPEGIHQARVALRRLRSDLRTFRPLLDRAWANDLRLRAKRLSHALGDVRDDDVHLAMAEAADAGPGACEGLDDERRQHRAALLAALDQPATRRLLATLVGAANEPATLPEADRRAEDALAPLVRKRWHHLRTAVHDLPDEPSTAELHAVRIQVKRTRYAVLATSAAFGKRSLTFAKRLGDLQDTLGDLHDCELLADRLREVAADLSPVEAYAAGEAAERLRSQAVDARANWPRRWRKVKHAAPKWL